jgi:hypothetical protein
MEIDQENKVIVYINSNQRSSGTDSNFQFSIPNFPVSKNFDSCCLLTAIIPKSFYTLPNGFNTFTLFEGASSVLITMPPGNYNISSLLYTLTYWLNTLSPNGNTYVLTNPSPSAPDTILIPNTTKDISNDPDTGKILFQTSGTQNTHFVFGNVINICQAMGFNTNSTSATFTSTIPLIAPNVVNVTVLNTIYISMDEVNNGIDNILQEIPNSTLGSMGIINYQNTNIEAWSKPYKGNKQNVWHIRLIDEYQNTIQMNGVYWSMSLLLYKRETLKYDLTKILNKFSS